MQRVVKYQNAIKCTKCEEVVVSKHRHHFVQCKCKESFVEGGVDYQRYGGAGVPVSLPFDPPWVIDVGHNEEVDDPVEHMRNALIHALEEQLKLEHTTPHSRLRLERALELMKEATQAWRTPGQQNRAQELEREAGDVLRHLLEPL